MSDNKKNIDLELTLHSNASQTLEEMKEVEAEKQKLEQSSEQGSITSPSDAERLEALNGLLATMQAQVANTQKQFEGLTASMEGLPVFGSMLERSLVRAGTTAEGLTRRIDGLIKNTNMSLENKQNAYNDLLISQREYNQLATMVTGDTPFGINHSKQYMQGIIGALGQERAAGLNAITSDIVNVIKRRTAPNYNGSDAIARSSLNEISDAIMADKRIQKILEPFFGQAKGPQGGMWGDEDEFGNAAYRNMQQYIQHLVAHTMAPERLSEFTKPVYGINLNRAQKHSYTDPALLIPESFKSAWDKEAYQRRDTQQSSGKYLSQQVMNMLQAQMRDNPVFAKAMLTMKRSRDNQTLAYYNPHGYVEMREGLTADDLEDIRSYMWNQFENRTSSTGLNSWLNNMYLAKGTEEGDSSNEVKKFIFNRMQGGSSRQSLDALRMLDSIESMSDDQRWTSSRRDSRTERKEITPMKVGYDRYVIGKHQLFGGMSGTTNYETIPESEMTRMLGLEERGHNSKAHDRIALISMDGYDKNNAEHVQRVRDIFKNGAWVNPETGEMSFEKVDGYNHMIAHASHQEAGGAVIRMISEDAMNDYIKKNEAWAKGLGFKGNAFSLYRDPNAPFMSEEEAGRYFDALNKLWTPTTKTGITLDRTIYDEKGKMHTVPGNIAIIDTRDETGKIKYLDGIGFVSEDMLPANMQFRGGTAFKGSLRRLPGETNRDFAIRSGLAVKEDINGNPTEDYHWWVNSPIKYETKDENGKTIMKPVRFDAINYNGFMDASLIKNLDVVMDAAQKQYGMYDQNATNDPTMLAVGVNNIAGELLRHHPIGQMVDYDSRSTKSDYLGTQMTEYMRISPEMQERQRADFEQRMKELDTLEGIKKYVFQDPNDPLSREINSATENRARMLIGSDEAQTKIKEYRDSLIQRMSRHEWIDFSGKEFGIIENSMNPLTALYQAYGVPDGIVKIAQEALSNATDKDGNKLFGTTYDIAEDATEDRRKAVEERVKDILLLRRSRDIDGREISNVADFSVPNEEYIAFGRSPTAIGSFVYGKNRARELGVIFDALANNYDSSKIGNLAPRFVETGGVMLGQEDWNALQGADLDGDLIKRIIGTYVPMFKETQEFHWDRVKKAGRPTKGMFTWTPKTGDGTAIPNDENIKSSYAENLIEQQIRMGLADAMARRVNQADLSDDANLELILSSLEGTEAYNYWSTLAKRPGEGKVSDYAWNSLNLGKEYSKFNLLDITPGIDLPLGRYFKNDIKPEHISDRDAGNLDFKGFNRKDRTYIKRHYNVDNLEDLTLADRKKIIAQRMRLANLPEGALNDKSSLQQADEWDRRYFKASNGVIVDMDALKKINLMHTNLPSFYSAAAQSGALFRKWASPYMDKSMTDAASEGITHLIYDSEEYADLGERTKNFMNMYMQLFPANESGEKILTSDVDMQRLQIAANLAKEEISENLSKKSIDGNLYDFENQTYLRDENGKIKTAQAESQRLFKELGIADIRDGGINVVENLKNFGMTYEKVLTDQNMPTATRNMFLAGEDRQLSRPYETAVMQRARYEKAQKEQEKRREEELQQQAREAAEYDQARQTAEQQAAQQAAQQASQAQAAQEQQAAQAQQAAQQNAAAAQQQTVLSASEAERKAYADSRLLGWNLSNIEKDPIDTKVKDANGKLLSARDYTEYTVTRSMPFIAGNGLTETTFQLPADRLTFFDNNNNIVTDKEYKKAVNIGVGNTNAHRAEQLKAEIRAAQHAGEKGWVDTENTNADALIGSAISYVMDELAQLPTDELTSEKTAGLWNDFFNSQPKELLDAAELKIDEKTGRVRSALDGRKSEAKRINKKLNTIYSGKDGKQQPGQFLFNYMSDTFHPFDSEQWDGEHVISTEGKINVDEATAKRLGLTKTSNADDLVKGEIPFELNGIFDSKGNPVMSRFAPDYILQGANGKFIVGDHKSSWHGAEKGLLQAMAYAHKLEEFARKAWEGDHYYDPYKMFLTQVKDEQGNISYQSNIEAVETNDAFAQDDNLRKIRFAYTQDYGKKAWDTIDKAEYAKYQNAVRTDIENGLIKIPIPPQTSTPTITNTSSQANTTSDQSSSSNNQQQPEQPPEDPMVALLQKAADIQETARQRRERFEKAQTMYSEVANNGNELSNFLKKDLRFNDELTSDEQHFNAMFGWLDAFKRQSDIFVKGVQGADDYKDNLELQAFVGNINKAVIDKEEETKKAFTNYTKHQAKMLPEYFRRKVNGVSESFVKDQDLIDSYDRDIERVSKLRDAFVAKRKEQKLYTEDKDGNWSLTEAEDQQIYDDLTAAIESMTKDKDRGVKGIQLRANRRLQSERKAERRILKSLDFTKSGADPFDKVDSYFDGIADSLEDYISSRTDTIKRIASDLEATDDQGNKIIKDEETIKAQQARSKELQQDVKDAEALKGKLDEYRTKRTKETEASWRRGLWGVREETLSSMTEGLSEIMEHGSPYDKTVRYNELHAAMEHNMKLQDESRRQRLNSFNLSRSLTPEEQVRESYQARRMQLEQEKINTSHAISDIELRLSSKEFQGELSANRQHVKDNLEKERERLIEHQKQIDALREPDRLKREEQEEIAEVRDRANRNLNYSLNSMRYQRYRLSDQTDLNRLTNTAFGTYQRFGESNPILNAIASKQANLNNLYSQRDSQDLDIERLNNQITEKQNELDKLNKEPYQAPGSSLILGADGKPISSGTNTDTENERARIQAQIEELEKQRDAATEARNATEERIATSSDRRDIAALRRDLYMNFVGNAYGTGESRIASLVHSGLINIDNIRNSKDSTLTDEQRSKEEENYMKALREGTSANISVRTTSLSQKLAQMTRGKNMSLSERIAQQYQNQILDAQQTVNQINSEVLQVQNQIDQLETEQKATGLSTEKSSLLEDLKKYVQTMNGLKESFNKAMTDTLPQQEERNKRYAREDEAARNSNFRTNTLNEAQAINFATASQARRWDMSKNGEFESHYSRAYAENERRINQRNDAFNKKNKTLAEIQNYNQQIKDIDRQIEELKPNDGVTLSAEEQKRLTDLQTNRSYMERKRTALRGEYTEANRQYNESEGIINDIYSLARLDRFDSTLQMNELLNSRGTTEANMLQRNHAIERQKLESAITQKQKDFDMWSEKTDSIKDKKSPEFEAALARQQEVFDELDALEKRKDELTALQDNDYYRSTHEIERRTNTLFYGSDSLTDKLMSGVEMVRKSAASDEEKQKMNMRLAQDYSTASDIDISTNDINIDQLTRGRNLSPVEAVQEYYKKQQNQVKQLIAKLSSEAADIESHLTSKTDMNGNAIDENSEDGKKLIEAMQKREKDIKGQVEKLSDYEKNLLAQYQSRDMAHAGRLNTLQTDMDVHQYNVAGNQAARQIEQFERNIAMRRYTRSYGIASRFAQEYNWRESMKDQAANIIESNEGKMKRLDYAREQLQHKVDQGENVESNKAKIAALDAEYKKLQDSIARARKEQEQFNHSFNLLKSIGSVISQTVGMIAKRLGTRIWRKAMQEAIQFTKQFNQAMTEIQMVTLKTDEQIGGLGDKLIDTAVKLKAPIKDVTSAATALYRQGLDDTQVEERLNEVIKFSTTAGVKAADAVKLITVAMNSGMVDSAKQAMDVISALGDSAATTAAEITKGLQKSIYAASEVGVSFNELVSMLTAMTANTQLGGNVAGTAMQTFMGRYAKVGSKELMYDENGNEISGSDLTNIFKQLGVDIYKGGERLPFMKALSAVAEQWDDLSPARKGQFAYAFGGQRQYSNINALMSAMAERDENGVTAIDKYLKLSENSEGMTDEKYSYYLDSLNASLTNLKNTFDSLVESLTDSGALTGFIDFLTNAIAGVEKLTSGMGSLEGILTTFAALLPTLLLFMTGHPILGLAAGAATVAGLSIFNSSQPKYDNQYEQVQDNIESENAANTKRIKALKQRASEINERRDEKGFLSAKDSVSLKNALTELQNLGAISDTASSSIEEMAASANKTKEALDNAADSTDKFNKRQLEQLWNAMWADFFNNNNEFETTREQKEITDIEARSFGSYLGVKLLGAAMDPFVLNNGKTGSDRIADILYGLDLRGMPSYVDANGKSTELSSMPIEGRNSLANIINDYLNAMQNAGVTFTNYDNFIVNGNKKVDAKHGNVREILAAIIRAIFKDDPDGRILGDYTLAGQFEAQDESKARQILTDAGYENTVVSGVIEKIKTDLNNNKITPTKQINLFDYADAYMAEHSSPEDSNGEDSNDKTPKRRGISSVYSITPKNGFTSLADSLYRFMATGQNLLYKPDQAVKYLDEALSSGAFGNIENFLADTKSADLNAAWKTMTEHYEAGTITQDDINAVMYQLSLLGSDYKTVGQYRSKNSILNSARTNAESIISGNKTWTTLAEDEQLRQRMQQDIISVYGEDVAARLSRGEKISDNELRSLSNQYAYGVSTFSDSEIANYARQLMAFKNEHDGAKFSAKDIANYFDISEADAERILSIGNMRELMGLSQTELESGNYDVDAMRRNTNAAIASGLIKESNYSDISKGIVEAFTPGQLYSTQLSEYSKLIARNDEIDKASAAMRRLNAGVGSYTASDLEILKNFTGVDIDITNAEQMKATVQSTYNELVKNFEDGINEGFSSLLSGKVDLNTDMSTTELLATLDSLGDAVGDWLKTAIEDLKLTIENGKVKWDEGEIQKISQDTIASLLAGINQAGNIDDIMYSGMIEKLNNTGTKFGLNHFTGIDNERTQTWMEGNANATNIYAAGINGTLDRSFAAMLLGGMRNPTLNKNNEYYNRLLGYYEDKKGVLNPNDLIEGYILSELSSLSGFTELYKDGTLDTDKLNELKTGIKKYRTNDEKLANVKDYVSQIITGTKDRGTLSKSDNLKDIQAIADMQEVLGSEYYDRLMNGENISKFTDYLYNKYQFGTDTANSLQYARWASDILAQVDSGTFNAKSWQDTNGVTGEQYNNILSRFAGLDRVISGSTDVNDRYNVEKAIETVKHLDNIAESDYADTTRSFVSSFGLGTYDQQASALAGLMSNLRTYSKVSLAAGTAQGKSYDYMKKNEAAALSELQSFANREIDAGNFEEVLQTVTERINTTLKNYVQGIANGFEHVFEINKIDLEHDMNTDEIIETLGTGVSDMLKSAIRELNVRIENGEVLFDENQFNEMTSEIYSSILYGLSSGDSMQKTILTAMRNKRNGAEGSLSTLTGFSDATIKQFMEGNDLANILFNASEETLPANIRNLMFDAMLNPVTGKGSSYQLELLKYFRDNQDSILSNQDNAFNAQILSDLNGVAGFSDYITNGVGSIDQIIADLVNQILTGSVGKTDWAETQASIIKGFGGTYSERTSTMSSVLSQRKTYGDALRAIERIRAGELTDQNLQAVQAATNRKDLTLENIEQNLTDVESDVYSNISNWTTGVGKGIFDTLQLGSSPFLEMDSESLYNYALKNNPQIAQLVKSIGARYENGEVVFDTPATNDQLGSFYSNLDYASRNFANQQERSVLTGLQTIFGNNQYAGQKTMDALAGMQGLENVDWSTYIKDHADINTLIQARDEGSITDEQALAMLEPYANPYQSRSSNYYAAYLDWWKTHEDERDNVFGQHAQSVLGQLSSWSNYVNYGNEEDLLAEIEQLDLDKSKDNYSQLVSYLGAWSGSQSSRDSLQSQFMAQSRTNANNRYLLDAMEQGRASTSTYEQIASALGNGWTADMVKGNQALARKMLEQQMQESDDTVRDFFNAELKQYADVLDNQNLSTPDVDISSIVEALKSTGDTAAQQLAEMIESWSESLGASESDNPFKDKYDEVASNIKSNAAYNLYGMAREFAKSGIDLNNKDDVTGWLEDNQYTDEQFNNIISDSEYVAFTEARNSGIITDPMYDEYLRGKQYGISGRTTEYGESLMSKLFGGADWTGDASSLDLNSARSVYQNMLAQGFDVDSELQATGVEGMEDLISAFKDGTTTGEEFADVMSKVNNGFDKKHSSDVHRYADNAEEVASNFNTLKGRAKDVTSFMSNMNKTMAQANDNQYWRSQYRKGNRNNDVLDKISEMTGFDKKDLTDKSKADVIEEALQRAEEGDLDMINDYIDTFTSDIQDAVNAQGAIEIIGPEVYVSGGTVTMSSEEVLSQLGAFINEDVAAMIQMMQAAGVEAYWDISEVNGKLTAKLNTSKTGFAGGGTGRKASGGGGGGGNSETDAQKLLKRIKHGKSLYEHQIKMVQYEETKYQNKGELSNYGKMLEEEIKLEQAYQPVLETNIQKIKDQMAATKSGSDDWYDLRDALLAAEEEMSELNNTIEENQKKLEENQEAIRQTRITLEDMLAQEIQNRIQKQRDMLAGTVSMQDTILQAIRDRYTKEWELVKKDIDKKKQALEEEKSLIDERLQMRKDAEDEAEKYEELAELKKQLALIEMDSTRTKDAAEMRKKISDIEKDIGWDIAEKQADAQKASIDDQTKAYDDYVTAGDEQLATFLEDANNFTSEMTEIMGMNHDQLFAWLQNNVDEFKNSLAKAQEQMVQSWNDTWKQMTGQTDTYWDWINQILATKESFLDFMKQSDDYINKSATEQQSLLYTWGQQYDAMIDANILNASWYHDDPNTGDWYGTEYVGGKGGSGSGSGSGGSSNNSGSNKNKNNKNGPSITPVVDEAKDDVVDITDLVYGNKNKTPTITPTSNVANIVMNEVKNRILKTAVKADTGTYTGDQEGLLYVHEKERVLNAQQTAAFEELVDTAEQMYHSNMFDNIIEAMHTYSDFVRVPSMLSDFSPSDFKNSTTSTIGDVIITLNEAKFEDEADYEAVARHVGEQFVKELTRQGLGVPVFGF